MRNYLTFLYIWNKSNEIASSIISVFFLREFFFCALLSQRLEQATKFPDPSLEKFDLRKQAYSYFRLKRHVFSRDSLFFPHFLFFQIIVSTEK